MFFFKFRLWKAVFLLNLVFFFQKWPTRSLLILENLDCSWVKIHPNRTLPGIEHRTSQLLSFIATNATVALLFTVLSVCLYWCVHYDSLRYMGRGGWRFFLVALKQVNPRGSLIRNLKITIDGCTIYIWEEMFQIVQSSCLLC